MGRHLNTQGHFCMIFMMEVPVLFYEGEKDNEEDNQKLQDEEEDIQ